MNRVSAPGYDLFKLVVSLILAAILLLMLLRGCATTAAAPSITQTSAAPNFTATSGEPLNPTETVPAPPATETVVPSTSVPTSTEPASTSTLTPVSDSSTPTGVSATTPTTALAFTETSTSEAVVTTAGESACNTRVPSRLEIGQRARVTQRLNMRDDASIAAPILSTNPTGTEVDVIGGPVCTPGGERAYLWWQIRLPDGVEGWSVEMQLNEPSYLLEPIP